VKKYSYMYIILLGISLLLLLSPRTSAALEMKVLIHDEAKLLTEAEYIELNQLANQYGAERETDIIILTSNNEQNKDVELMTEDFYDDYAPGYDKPHGNAVILALDMKNRDVYLAGFYKAETYLDDGRLDKIRNKITSYLTEGNYAGAFEKYIVTTHRYMGFKPGVDPDNILFNIWFQFIVSAIIAGTIVGMMAYRSGGKVTVNRQTYEDVSTSGLLDHQDRYIRTTVTKTKIEKSSSGGGGGGGGISGGGHSHSGSRGKF